jgi:hypothetical protein
VRRGCLHTLDTGLEPEASLSLKGSATGVATGALLLSLLSADFAAFVGERLLVSFGNDSSESKDGKEAVADVSCGAEDWAELDGLAVGAAGCWV